ncbi:IclR family transcriptional regulator domain-containing protein [Anianabacter salinae]|uniref:IclR family transcriptional regulator domain-containing protein n=1 Tax=Anianabacter salinae TaxID=2851023 RepID=UPI00225DEC69|nr:IclR family transcriptional regulator C-terminal domain-containing protein [Anianabacter salinae]MBV0913829.1 helix-turn-helix domain-containing protein [Anianabacter salinae]
MSDDTGAGKPRAPEGMGGLAKGLAIIEAFSETRREMTVAKAAQAAAISRASARRCLLTLAELGYVRQLGSAYLPTPRMLRLGDAFFESSTLPQLAQSHLDDARDQLNESVSLAVLEEGNSVFVARAEVTRPVSSYVRIGAKLPAYASATGRMLLADLADEDVDRYLSTTDFVPLSPKTETDPDRLRDLVRDVRARGYSVICEELELGMLAMAVPVRNRNGRTVAALSISAAIARVGLEQAEREFLPVLLARADALSRML